MAIISFGPKRGTRSSGIDKILAREYSNQFTIETDSPNVGPLAVRSYVGMIGTWYTNGLDKADPNYEFDEGSFVQAIKVAEDGDSGVQWTATVDYGPIDWSAFQQEAELWPIRVSIGGERTEKVIYFDNAGNSIRNSATDPFGDPIITDDSRTVLTITRNETVSTFALRP